MTDLISTYYETAGVLPYNTQNQPFSFLGEENYKMKKGFCDFGGKIENDDSQRPELTAFREFTETEGLFTITEYNTLREQLISKGVYTSPVIWNKPARYGLFLLHIPLLVDQTYKTNPQSPTHPHNNNNDFIIPMHQSYHIGGLQ